MSAIKTAADLTYADGPVENPTEPSKAEIRSLFTLIDTSVEIATAGLVEAATWSVLDAIDGTRAGQPGQVVGPDAGTHTDPVVGGTVANVGRYAWSTSPAGWQRIGEYVDLDDAKGGYASVNARLDDEVTSIPGVFDLMRPKVTLAAGATMILLEGGRELGFTIPIGQSGQNTTIVARLDIDEETASDLSLATNTFKARFSTSTALGRTLTPTVRLIARDGSITTPAISNLDSNQVSSSARVISFDVAIASTTAVIEITFTQATSGAAAAEEFAAMTVLTHTVRESTHVSQSGEQIMTGVGAQLALHASAPDIGPLSGDAAYRGFVYNGATYRLADDGSAIGWDIPTGQTGEDTLIQVQLPLDAPELAIVPGATVVVTFLCHHSADYDRPLQLVISDEDGVLATFAVRYIRVSSDYTVISARAVILDTSTALWPYVQSTGTVAAASDEWLEVADVSIGVLSSEDQIRSAAQLAAHWGALRLKRRTDLAIEQANNALIDRRASSEAVAITSTATDVSASVAAGAAPSSARRRKVTLADGTYAQRVIGRAFTDLVGEDPHTTKISLAQADSEALATIEANSALEWYWDGDVEGLTIEVENGRYAVHSDNAEQPEGYHQRLRDAVIRHLGNDGARAYQAGLPADPDLVWASTAAWGTGTGPGWVLDAQRCVFEGRYAAVTVHNNLAFSKASKMRLRNSALSATSGTALIIEPLGSGRRDIVEIEGCSLGGDILYQTGLWLPTALADQPADHSEFLVHGFGNTPAVFRIEDFGRALKIESVETTPPSSVAVSGTGATALFGTVTRKDGAGGFKGYSYGAFDISETLVGPSSDTNVHSMGKRLGDCSSVNKTLTVTIDGGAPIDIVFSTDLTAASNATILATINAALSGVAVASEFAVGELYRPRFSDEERTLLNSSADGIEKGMACAYATDGVAIRKMTSADPHDLFAGVAWEDIYPDEMGRVKTRGHLPITDILRDDTREVGVGTAFSVSAVTAGKWVVGGNALLVSLRADAVRLTDGKVETPVYATEAELGATLVSPSVASIVVAGSVLRRVTSAHPRLGSELVVNGAFAADTDWTKGTGWTIAGGVAVAAAGTESEIAQVATLTDAAPYLAAADFTVTGGLFRFDVGFLYGDKAISSSGYYEEIMEVGTSDVLGIYKSDTGAGTVDNLSVKALPADAVKSLDGAWWAANEAP